MLISAETEVFCICFSTDKLFKSISNIMQRLISIVNVYGEILRVAVTAPHLRHTT